MSASRTTADCGPRWAAGERRSACLRVPLATATTTAPYIQHPTTTTTTMTVLFIPHPTKKSTKTTTSVEILPPPTILPQPHSTTQHPLFPIVPSSPSLPPPVPLPTSIVLSSSNTYYNLPYSYSALFSSFFFLLSLPLHLFILSSSFFLSFSPLLLSISIS